MNDEKIFSLTDISARTGIEKISFEFEDAYTNVVYCIIHRCQRGLIPVMSHSDNSDDALKEALELIEQVKPWDNVLKMPDQKEQPWYHGYYRQMLDKENEIQFQNIGRDFAITRITRKDSNGFYYSEKPYPVDKKHTFVKDLPDGSQLYTWDDIGFLSGTAGELIVKDGLVIKSRMTAIS